MNHFSQSTCIFGTGVGCIKEYRLWCLTSLSTILLQLRYVMTVSFIGGENGVPEKTTDLSQVTDKTLPHNIVSSTPRHDQNSNSQR
jgi:hypothetical protein